MRIRGLDTLRFVLAVLVVLSHFGTPPVFGRTAGGILNAGVNGVAAVMGFFVVSGFCIHYPFRHEKPAGLLGYYLRRYVRIGVPMLVAMAVAKLCGAAISPFEESVLWSLYAEIVYYTIYPLLMRARRAFGWNVLLAGAFAAALGVVATDPSMRPYHGHGPYLTWILGLPVWLLGCRLAERADEPSAAVSSLEIWSWRALVWLVGVVTLQLRYRGPVGFPIGLTLAAPLFVRWIGREIDHFRRVEPPRSLEWAGRWSYSLYLMHMPVFFLFRGRGLDPATNSAAWCLAFGTTIGVSYLFFRLVELPSHLLARAAERRLNGSAGGIERRTARGMAPVGSRG